MYTFKILTNIVYYTFHTWKVSGTINSRFNHLLWNYHVSLKYQFYELTIETTIKQGTTGKQKLIFFKTKMTKYIIVQFSKSK